MADPDTLLSILIEMMLRLTTSVKLCVPLYCCDPPEFPLHWHCPSTSGCPTWKEILFSHRHLFCDLYIEIIVKGIYIYVQDCAETNSTNTKICISFRKKFAIKNAWYTNFLKIMFVLQ